MCVDQLLRIFNHRGDKGAQRLHQAPLLPSSTDSTLRQKFVNKAMLTLPAADYIIRV
jgi:hypothetical protein